MSRLSPQQGDRQMNQVSPDGQRRLPRILGKTLKVVLPVAILVGGAGLAFGLIETGPTVERKPPVRQAKLVEVEPIHFGQRTITIQAMGTVGPDKEVELRPRVGGQVVWLSDEYVPGGVLNEGERLLKIDPKDYELVVQQKKADVAKAESELKIEQGQQNIAKKEFELLGKNITAEGKALVLRQPQLASVEADLAAAKSALAQAQLDLARTDVSVPFNAVVQSRDVNLGTQVTSSTTVATLVGTDSFLIEVAVPVDQLKWLKIPRKNGDVGSPVRIYNETAWGADTYRNGRVVRLASELESDGRLAQLLVAIDDPMALKAESQGQPVLLIGTYVRVVIEGIEVGPVAVIDRKYVHDGNKVWLMTDDDKLITREIEVLYRGAEEILASGGLESGERLVTTVLSAPVDGMALRTRDQTAQTAGGQGGMRKPAASGGAGER